MTDLTDMPDATPPEGEKTADSARHTTSDEERFLLAVRGANDGLWDWDLTTDTVYYSPRWYEMLGIARDELDDTPATLQTWIARVHPADRERVLAQLEAFVEAPEAPQQRLVVEHRLRHHNGRYRWMLARAAARRDSNGRALRIAGWPTDVTDDK